MIYKELGRLGASGVEYTNGYLKRIAHTEGYVSCDGSIHRHEYVINDHLGNARVTYTDANNDETITVNEIAQVNHYYPFGLNMEGNWSVTTYDYVNGVEYTNGYLKRIAHTEGYVSCDGSSTRHEYVIKDHLGNARVTYTDANNDETITVNEIAQVNHYYPFGLNMEGNWPGADGKNKYQYNGKEWNDDFGLGLNDYGARFYDPALARWTAVDPLADAYHAYSPYAYVLNNPIRLIDPNGMYSEDPIASRSTSELAQDVSNVGGSGSSNIVAICPTCNKDNPDHKPYIDDPNNLYTNSDGIIVNGDGSGAVVTAQRNRPSPVDFFGASLQAADDYDTFFHNHDTYKTTKNEVKTIRKPNGKVRSARALKFARLSTVVKALGPLGDAYTIYSLSQEDYLDNWDYLDGAVAVVSIAATAATLVISAPVVATTAAVIGVVGAVYGTARLGYSIYENIK